MAIISILDRIYQQSDIEYMPDTGTNQRAINLAKQCNINTKGKAIRLFIGFILILLAGIVGVLLALGSAHGLWLWVIALGLLAMGTFALYEGWSGWCAMRAMGLKTWI